VDRGIKYMGLQNSPWERKSVSGSRPNCSGNVYSLIPGKR